MKSNRTVWTTAILALLLTGADRTLAAEDATSSPAPAPDPRAGWCAQNPARCEQIRARRAEWCTAHPERCEAMKQRRAERRAWCEQNPEECAKQREQRRARLKELREKCAADPEKCADIRRQMRQRRDADVDATPLPPKP